MTREEQTIQAAKDFLPHITNAQLTLFAAGAMWADEHPKECLWDKEKVCNFLYNHLFCNVLLYMNADDPSLSPNITDKKTFIEDLCKTMEE